MSDKDPIKNLVIALDFKSTTTLIKRGLNSAYKAVLSKTPRGLNESWFPGVHSDIGGTLKEGLGAATLSWMFKQACVENSDQWDDDAMKEAGKNIDCDAEPSKNKITLPASFLNKYRTRKLESDDTKCCE